MLKICKNPVLACMIMSLLGCSKPQLPPTPTSPPVETRPQSESQRALETQATTQSETNPENVFEYFKENQPYFIQGTLHFTDKVSSQTLHFILKLTRKGKKIEGSSTYRGQSEANSIRGTLQPNGDLVLEEVLRNKEVATWKGRINVGAMNWDDELFPFVLDGKWQSSSSDKIFSVDAHPLPISAEEDLVTIYEKSFRKVFDLKKRYPKKRYEEDFGLVEIKIDYLYFSGKNSLKWTKLNKAIRQFLFNHPTIRKVFYDDCLANFSLDGELKQLNTRLAVIHYNYDRSSSCWPYHGFYSSITMNYDFEHQKILQLNDLFSSNAYLQKISDYCRTELQESIGTEFADEGVRPKPENFANWEITSEGITIYFDTYQVAPRPHGNPEVRISLSTIKSWNLLKPKMRILWP